MHAFDGNYFSIHNIFGIANKNRFDNTKSLMKIYEDRKCNYRLDPRLHEDNKHIPTQTSEN